MIAKELDEVTATDKRRTSDHAAEAQLAFYLRRTFAGTPDIHVFNGLRFESLGDAAQFDHLILHTCGLIVVESKSVHARVKINEYGEWLRLYKDHYQGMPPAKLQAERQVLFLRRYLELHSDQLLEASRGKRTRLSSMPIDLLVAISDGAVIDRPKGEAHDYLVKAEAVPERIKVLVKSRRPAGNFFRLFEDGFALSSAEMAGLGSFFKSHHRPLEQVSSTPVPTSPVTVPAVACGGDNLLRLTRIEAEGLFAQDRLSRFQTEERVLFVKGVGRRNVDDIDFSVLRERFVAVVPVREAEALTKGAGRISRPRAHRHQFSARQ